MPLDSYTLVHRGARLPPADVKTLCTWAGEEQMRIAATDSGCGARVLTSVIKR